MTDTEGTIETTTKIKQIPTVAKVQAMINTIYPIGSVYITYNTDILTPNEIIPGTFWNKIKSPIEYTTAWIRGEACYPERQLAYEVFKLLYPIGSWKTIFNKTGYGNDIMATKNYADLSTYKGDYWIKAGLNYQNNKFCSGLFDSDITPTKMITDGNLYFKEDVYTLMDNFFPVNSIMFFTDSEKQEAYYNWFMNNENYGKNGKYLVEKSTITATGNNGIDDFEFTYYIITRTK